MRIHTQKSDKKRGFWQPEFIGEILQATTYYWGGISIAIPETDISGLNDGDRIYIENDADPLHLVEKNAVSDYVPLSGDPKSSPGSVIWKEDGELHAVSHVEG